MCGGRREAICPYIMGGCSNGGLGWPPGRNFMWWSVLVDLNGVGGVIGVGVGVSGIGVCGNGVCGSRVCEMVVWGVIGESGKMVRGLGKADDLSLRGWF